LRSVCARCCTTRFHDTPLSLRRAGSSLPTLSLDRPDWSTAVEVQLVEAGD
jgi:hypothetical protein